MILTLQNQKDIEDLQNSLDSANAMALSFGSTQNKQNNRSFSKWFKKKQRQLKKLLGIKPPLFWDNLNKSRRL